MLALLYSCMQFDSPITVLVNGKNLLLFFDMAIANFK